MKQTHLDNHQDTRGPIEAVTGELMDIVMVVLFIPFLPFALLVALLFWAGRILWAMVEREPEKSTATTTTDLADGGVASGVATFRERARRGHRPAGAAERRVDSWDPQAWGLPADWSYPPENESA